MSFSSELKENLSKMANLKNKELVKQELIGYLISNNTVCDSRNIYYSTINEYNINRFSKLISNLSIQNFKIELKGKNYIIRLPKIKDVNEIKYDEKDIGLSDIFNDKVMEINELNQDKENEIKSFIRGIFLGSGSVNNPENKYHLEIILRTKESAKTVKKILDKIGINMKELERKNGFSLYLKEGEEISNFLAFIGANNAVLKFEEIRVLRDMKNNINRKVNCETANISKIVNAAVKQTDAIKKLQQTGKFEKLSDNLKEIATLRIENPDASLIELGQMLKNPIGKSGVNHRLKQIEELSK
ncbi:MAG: DNA-binding protein WhiA [Clostridiaceae bacterium]|nr:DNA-binding protein WhiA [Clostridiaceae bacterium]